jgi:RNA polymerase sigma factor (sigma-70 family)
MSAIDVAERNRPVAFTFERERQRLGRFIRARVGNLDEADDILQDVFCELVEATRMMQPIEHVSAWLFRVARNRITDLFRKKKPDASLDAPVDLPRGPALFEDLLPSLEAGPETAYARAVLVDELAAAIDELPRDQRAVFVAHEIEGRSFKDLAAETGLPLNTLLSRKHYAVRHLRRRLQTIYDEWRNV